MTDLLFDAPWWLLAALLIGGAALFASGNKRQQRGTRTAGIAVAVAGVLLGALSYFVDTDVEAVLRRTDRMVQSVAKRDWATLQSLLAPNTSFAGYHNREALIEGAKANVERYGVTSATVTQRVAQQADTVITVNLSLISVQDVTMARPIRSSWQFTWQESAEGWLLSRIDAVSVEQLTGEEVTRRLVKK